MNERIRWGGGQCVYASAKHAGQFLLAFLSCSAMSLNSAPVLFSSGWTRTPSSHVFCQATFMNRNKLYLFVSKWLYRFGNMSHEQEKAVLVTLQMSTNMDVCSDVAGAEVPLPCYARFQRKRNFTCI